MAAGDISFEEAFILQAYEENILDEEDAILAFLLLEKETKEPIVHSNYNRFNLNHMDETECEENFRFEKGDIPRLAQALRLPDTFIGYQGTACKSVEGLCLLLRRLSYPCRYVDLIPRFGRAKAELSIISNLVLDYIYTEHGHLLNTFRAPWMSRRNLTSYCQAIYDNGAALNNCWGFVDGTVRPICRPGRNQRHVYNGHKRVHALKYQSVVAPNGLIVNMFGPVVGKRHDARMFTESGLRQQLQQHSFDTNGRPLCIYGDPVYPVSQHIIGPFRGANLNNLQKNFNTSMSSVRVTVEWPFGGIASYFAYVDFKKNLKLYLQAVGKLYLVSTILYNARVCLYGSLTSQFFELDPPILEDYLGFI